MYDRVRYSALFPLSSFTLYHDYANQDVKQMTDGTPFLLVVLAAGVNISCKPFYVLDFRNRVFSRKEKV
jgi:hypothetical protein